MRPANVYTVWARALAPNRRRPVAAKAMTPRADRPSAVAAIAGAASRRTDRRATPRAARTRPKIIAAVAAAGPTRCAPVAGNTSDMIAPATTIRPPATVQALSSIRPRTTVVVACGASGRPGAEL